MSAGFVGVRTSTPTTVLDVNGDAQFGSGTTKSTFTATGLLKLTSSGIQWADGTTSTTAASGGGGGSSGGLLQFVSSQTAACWPAKGAAIPADDTIPQISEGQQVLVATMTPTASTSRLLIRAAMMIGEGTNSCNGNALIAVFTDSTANSFCVGVNNQPDNSGSLDVSTAVAECVIAAGSTTQRNYSVRIGCAQPDTISANCSSNSRIYGGAMNSILTISEFGP